MAVKYLANIGIAAISIDNVDLTAAFGAGSEFALSIPTNGTPTVTWQTVITGTITSITVSLEASLDGTNWDVVDSSTSITGEVRTITGSYRFIRINNSAVVGGAGDELTASFVYSNAVSVDSGGSSDLTIDTTVVIGGEDSVLYVDGGILKGDATLLGFDGTTLSRTAATFGIKNLQQSSSITLSTINASSGNAAGGTVNIIGGNGFGVGGGGSINITGGNSATVGGIITLTPGPSAKITLAGTTVVSPLTVSQLVVTDSTSALASNGAITTNTLPKSASSGATLVDSALSDDGTNVTSTEPILLPDGSASNTACGFALDSGLGMYRIGTDQLGFSSSNTLTLQIDQGNGGVLVRNGNLIVFENTNQVKIGTDTGFSRLAASIIKTTNGSSGDGWLQQAAGRKRLVSTVTNVTTTMANLTELSVDLIAGRKYTFKLILFVENSTTTDGVKVDFEGGTATMTSFRAHGLIFDAALLLSLQSTALATDFAAATITGAGMIEINGGFVCNAGGTFIPRQAMVTAVSGTLSTYLNSHLWVEDMPA